MALPDRWRVFRRIDPRREMSIEDTLNEISWHITEASDALASGNIKVAAARRNGGHVPTDLWFALAQASAAVAIAKTLAVLTEHMVRPVIVMQAQPEDDAPPGPTVDALVVDGG